MTQFNCKSILRRVLFIRFSNKGSARVNIVFSAFFLQKVSIKNVNECYDLEKEELKNIRDGYEYVFFIAVF